jgi:hypothetical protein
MFHQVILTYIGMNKSFKSNDFDENRVSYIDIGRDQLNERARSLNTGGAKTDVNSVTMGGFPLFVIKFIGSPFIWQAQKPIQYLSSIEAIIYQFMMLYIIINIYHLKRLSFLPFKMHWIVFLLITSAIFGAAYTNYGLTIRQKCQIIPALVMLYLAVRKHKETSLNDKKRDVNKVKVFPMPNYT